jgi:hypothetical protein
MTTFQDADTLVPWAAPNNAALAWEPLEEAVLRALGGPIPDEYREDPDLPLLRFANLDVPARPLVTAITDPPIPRGRSVCDITGTLMREPNTLWVPCGRSVVQVTMRNSVRENLAFFTTCDLIWS